MSMSANSMAGRIEAHMSAITPVQGSDAGAANAYRHAVLVAMCQGIIEEIVASATVRVSAVQPGSGTANGVVTG